jgi:PAS domain S-box-containing protein
MVVYSALPDEHSTTILVSNAIQEITGYSADEFHKKPILWEEIIHDDDKERVWKAIQKHRKNKIPLKLTYRIMTRSGDIKWLKDEAIPVLDENKQIVRIDGYLEDITQLKKISGQIQYQSELVDNVSEAIISTDLDFKILSWNAAAEKIYGWTEKEVVGKRFVDVVKPVLRTGGREKFLRKFFTTGHWTGELIQKDKNGDELTIHSSISYVKDESGNPIGIVTVNRDVTQFKKAEKKIEDIARFPAQNPSPVLRLDIKGNILYANNPGKKFIKPWKKDDRYNIPTLFKKAVNEVVQSKKIKQVEFRNGNKTFLFSVVPIVGTDYVNMYGMEITKEVDFRNALKKSEERYRQLFNSMTEHFLVLELIYDKGGRAVDYYYREVNPALERLLGKSKGQIVGKRGKEIVGIVDDQWIELFDKVVKTGEPIHIENYRAALDKYIEFYVWKVTKNQVGLISTDITERWRMEEETKRLLDAIQNEKDRLSALVNSIADEVWFADTNKKFTLANPAALKEFTNGSGSFEMDLEKLEETLEILRPDRSPRPIEESPVLRALNDEVIKNQEEIVRTPASGELRYRQVTAAPVKDADGIIIGSVSVVRDITEQKKAEEALNKSEERYRHLFEDDLTGDFVATADGRILICNPAFVDIFRFSSREDAIGSSLAERCLTQDDYNEFVTLIRKNKVLNHFEADRRRCDGTIIHLVENIVGTFDEDGELIQFKGYIHDDTERKKAEDALLEAKHQLEKKVKERTAELEQINKQLKEENQKRLQALESLKLKEDRLDALFQISQLSEASIDKITNITLEKAISLTQSKIGFTGLLTEDESIYTLHSVSKDVTKDCNVVGDPIHWPVSDAGIWADAIRERKTLIVNDYSKPNPRKKGIPKGHLQLERFMIVPIFEDKKIVVVAGVANKISDYNKSDERQMILLLNGMWSYVQKNRSKEELQKAYDELEEKVKQRTAELSASNQALRKSEERYRLAQKAAEIGSWDWNILTGDLEWSETIEPMFGFQKGTFGKTYEAFLDCVHPDDRQFVIDSLDACLKNDVEYNIEHRIMWPDGSVHWVRETGDVIYDEKGTAIRMLGIVQDITARKKGEENIKKLNENLLRHTLELAAINKELEAFSYSVSHDLRAPLRSIDGFSLALLEDYADKLDEEGKDYIFRVRSATQHMGRIIDDLLRLSRVTRRPLEREEVDLSDLSRAIIDELQKENSKRMVEFVVADDLVIMGDRHLLYMALENLIGNAWKFTGKNPKAKIEVGKTRQKGQDVFFVKDNGAGFDMTYVDKLFIPFQRLHSDDEFPGIGIGLGIVSRIIHRHGGSIWAESEVGKGATFYFTIGGLKDD